MATYTQEQYDQFLNDNQEVLDIVQRHGKSLSDLPDNALDLKAFDPSWGQTVKAGGQAAITGFEKQGLGLARAAVESAATEKPPVTFMGKDYTSQELGSSFGDIVREVVGKETLDKLASTLATEDANASQKLADEMPYMSDPDSLKATTIDAIGGMLPTAVTGLAAGLLTRSPAAAAAAVGGGSFGSYYGDSRDKGLTPEQSRERATRFAAMEGATEFIPFKGVLGQLGKSSLTKGLLGKVATGAVTEGAQEGATTIAQAVHDKLAYGEELPDDLLHEAWRSAKAGALGGGALGAGGYLVSRAAPQVESQEPVNPEQVDLQSSESGDDLSIPTYLRDQGKTDAEPSYMNIPTQETVEETVPPVDIDTTPYEPPQDYYVDRYVSDLSDKARQTKMKGRDVIKSKNKIKQLDNDIDSLNDQRKSKVAKLWAKAGVVKGEERAQYEQQEQAIRQEYDEQIADLDAQKADLQAQIEAHQEAQKASKELSKIKKMSPAKQFDYVQSKTRPEQAVTETPAEAVEEVEQVQPEEPPETKQVEEPQPEPDNVSPLDDYLQEPEQPEVEQPEDLPVDVPPEESKRVYDRLLTYLTEIGQTKNKAKQPDLILAANKILGTPKNPPKNGGKAALLKRIENTAKALQSLDGETSESLKQRFPDNKSLQAFRKENGIKTRATTKDAMINSILAWRDKPQQNVQGRLDRQVLHKKLLDDQKNNRAISLDELNQLNGGFSTIYQEGDVQLAQAKGEQSVPPLEQQGEDYKQTADLLNTLEDNDYSMFKGLSEDQLQKHAQKFTDITNVDVLYLQAVRVMEDLGFSKPIARAVGYLSEFDIKDGVMSELERRDLPVPDPSWKQKQDANNSSKATVAQKQKESDSSKPPVAQKQSDTSKPKAIEGKAHTVYTTDNEAVKTTIKIVDADQLQASHDIEGKVNQDYPQELQPRDRSKPNLVAETKKNANNLNPERLDLSKDIATGAPIVKGEVVESGNGRTIAIKEAYRRGKGDDYKQYLIDNADKYGIDAKTIGSMAKPVLVLERQGKLSNKERQDFTKKANRDVGVNMSPVERAKSDAELLTDDDLLEINIGDTGDMNAASNHKFLTRFAQKLGDEEAAQYVGENNRWNAEMGKRALAAVFQKAYGDKSLTANVFEETSPDTKRVMSALARASGHIAKLKADTSGDHGLGDALAEAANVVRAANQKGQSASEYLAQMDMLDQPSPVAMDLAQLFSINATSAKRMGDVLVSLTKQIDNENQKAKSGSLFEEGGTPSLSDIIQANKDYQHATTKQTQTSGGQTSGDLFGANPARLPRTPETSSTGSKPTSKPRAKTQTTARVEQLTPVGEMTPEQIKSIATAKNKVERIKQLTDAGYSKGDALKLENKLNKSVTQLRAIKTIGQAVNALDNGRALIDWMGQRASNPVYKRIAQRIAPLVSPDLKIQVVKSGDKTIPSFMHSSKGHYQYDNRDGERITVWDEGEKFAVDETTLLHEMLHAATAQSLVKVRKGKASSELTQAVKALTELREAISENIIDRRMKDKLTALEKSGEGQFAIRHGVSSGLNANDEFISWGLSDPTLQSILKGIQLTPTKTAWNKFVSAVGKILGLKATDNTALGRLLESTDKLLTLIEKEQAYSTDSINLALEVRADHQLTKEQLQELQDTYNPDPVSRSAKDVYRDVVDSKLVKKAKQLASQGVGTATSNVMSKLRFQIANKTAPFSKVDEQLYGDNIIHSPTMRGAVLARSSNAAQGALMAMLHYGRIRYNNNQKLIETVGDKNTGGLMQVLGQLSEPNELDHFFMWMAANRAQRINQASQAALAEIDNIKAEKRNLRKLRHVPDLSKQQRNFVEKAARDADIQIRQLRKKANVKERFLTQDQIDLSLLLNKQNRKDGQSREALFDKVLKEFNQYRADVLKIAEDTGVISSENRAMWENEIYVPFYRVMEEEEQSGQMPTAGLSRQQAIKRLKGSEKGLGDLLNNSLMNFDYLLNASLKNRAAVQALENGEAVGIAEPTTEYSRDKKASTYVLVDGKKQWYNVSDADYLAALMSMGNIEFKGILKHVVRVGSTLKRGMTLFTTSTLWFVVRNFIKDSVLTPLFSNVNMRKGGVARGAKLWGVGEMNKVRADMLASGAAFEFGFRHENTKKQIDKKLKSKIVDHKTFAKMFSKGLNAFSEAQALAENANRAAVYDANLDKGKLYASFEAMDLMDFGAGGASPTIRLLNSTVPFLNAMIQGVDKVSRSSAQVYKALQGEASLETREQAIRFATGAASLALASIYLAFQNSDDEEYQELPEYAKNTNWYVRIGNGKGEYVLIPKPQGIGFVINMAERSTDNFTGVMKAKDTLDYAKRTFVDTFAVNVVPQLAKPIAEVYMNKNMFTGQAIESVMDEQYSKSERFDYRTSEVAKLLGNETLSPKQIDHLLKGYFSSVGEYVLNGIDMTVDSLSENKRPEQRLLDFQPFYKGGMTPAYTRSQNRFYDIYNEVKHAKNDYQLAVAMGDQEKANNLLKEKSQKIQLYKMMDKYKRKMGKISTEIKAVRNDKSLSAEEKRAYIDSYNQLRNTTYREVMDYVDQSLADSE